MKEIPLISLLLSALVIVRCNAEAPTDTNVSNADLKGPGQAVAKQQPQSAVHRIISCYACSTMDYENPADNPCRFMPKQVIRAPLQAAVGLATSMMNYAPTTTTTTTTTTPLSTTSTSISKISSLTSPNSQTSSSNLLPSTSNTAPSHDLSHYYGDSSSGVAPTSAPEFSQSHSESAHLANFPTTMMTPLRASSLGFNAGPYSHRIPPLGNFIRTRTCSDDENFCSIVSVVRIEFLNDSLVSRFWAMERNCSKSCNTGCMLIGERVRLRVCSHCCRTPNCNIGSGAPTILDSVLRKLVVLLSVTTTVILLNRFQ